MRTGIYISGAAHLLLIAWVMLAGLFSVPRATPLTSSDVSLISAEELAALSREAAAPAQVETIAPPATPALPRSPRPAPAPDNRPAAPVPSAPQVPAAPDAVPDTSGVQPVPEAEVAETVPEPIMPEVVEAPEAPLPDSAPPSPAPRVAPTAAPPPPDDVAISDLTPQDAVRPDSDAAQDAVEIPPAMPAEAATQTVTEAEQQPETGRALAASPRPRARPSPVQAAATPDQTPDAAADPVADPVPDAVADAVPDAAADPMADAVAQALAEAIGGAATTPGTGRALTGPSLSSGDREALRVAVSQCWNVGSLSTEALMTVVVVGVEMQENGRPRTETIRLMSWSGGSEAAARQTYESARRAIIRCGTTGFPLPPEKFDLWRDIEMTFDPGKMRTR